MQNHDFTMLEMLFSCTRTNILWQKCIWVGEKKIHKIWHAFLSGMNTICLKWPTYALRCVNGSSELGFSENFEFSSSSIEPKIYLYLMDSKNFRCSEKLWVWGVHFWGLWRPGTWSTALLRENVKRVSAKIQIGRLGRCAPPHIRGFLGGISLLIAHTEADVYLVHVVAFEPIMLTNVFSSSNT